MGTSGVGMLALVIVFLVATRLVPQGRKFLNGYNEAQLRREQAHRPAPRNRGTSERRLECPACGGTDFKPPPPRTARPGTADDGHLRVACMTCGVHYDRG